MSATLNNILSASASIALGAAVESVLGFGCNLVWMSFFPLFTTVQEAVAVHQPLGLSLNILILIRCYKHANFQQLKPLFLTMPLGIAFGLWVVTTWSVRWINLCLGSFLLLYTFWVTKKRDVKKDDDEGYDTEETASISIASGADVAVAAGDREMKLKRSKGICASQSPTSVIAGFLGGALTSAFGTGGPAILIYAKEKKWDEYPDTFRANGQIMFFAMHSLAVLSMVGEGVITVETAKASAALVPSIVVGGWIGSIVARRVKKDTFRILVINGLRLMGVVFIMEAVKS